MNLPIIITPTTYLRTCLNDLSGGVNAGISKATQYSIEKLSHIPSHLSTLRGNLDALCISTAVGLFAFYHVALDAYNSKWAQRNEKHRTKYTLCKGISCGTSLGLLAFGLIQEGKGLEYLTPSKLYIPLFGAFLSWAL